MLSVILSSQFRSQNCSDLEFGCFSFSFSFDALIFQNKPPSSSLLTPFLNVFLSSCWDINEDSPYWWIIKGPIVASIAVSAAARVQPGADPLP